MIRLIFAFCYTYTGNYKYRNIYINLEHLLFTNNANNDRSSNPESKYWKFSIWNPESTARNPESATGLDSLEVVARFLGASKLGQAELIHLC